MTYHRTNFLKRILRPAVWMMPVVAAAAVFASSAVPQKAEAGQRMVREVKVGGSSRKYIAHLPDNVSAKSSWPVVVAYHPALGTAAGMEKITKMHNAAAAGNFIIVYPEGFRRTWNAGDCCGLAEKRNIDDVGFYKAILADLGTIAPVQKKAYVTGYSNGARMVYHLICEVPELVAAGAPFAATRDMSQCKSGKVPLLHIHGGSDKGSPVEGGYAESAMIKRSLGYMTPATVAVSEVASRNGCYSSAKATISIGDLGTTCTKYSSCTSGEATLCIIPNLGHTWPGAPLETNALGKKFGPARPDLNGSRAVLAFFQRH